MYSYYFYIFGTRPLRFRVSLSSQNSLITVSLRSNTRIEGILTAVSPAATDDASSYPSHSSLHDRDIGLTMDIICFVVVRVAFLQ